MKIVEPNPHGILDGNILTEFESSLNARLPEGYRQYLLANNGGEWEPNCFVISEEEGEDSVHSVYGLHSGPEYSRLDVNREVFSDRIPKDLLAFACDPFGNQICIGIRGRRRGAIFFWDHEVDNNISLVQILGALLGKGSLAKIANSFEVFVAGLYKQEPKNIWEKILEENDIKELTRLLDLKIIGLDDVNEYDRTLLEEAAIKARPDIIELLFSRGAKLRGALKCAETNAEFFSQHIPIVALIKQLERRDQANT